MWEETDVARTDRVNALMRGLAILRMFNENDQAVAVSQMARHIGVHRSNASRLAATLHEMGFLDRAEGAGRYRLGPQLVRLGRLADRDNSAVKRAMEPLGRLVAETGETGHIGVLDGAEMVTAAVIDGWHTVRMHSHPHLRAPAHCSALGKALLSWLDDERLRERFADSELAARTGNSVTSTEQLRHHLAQARDRGYAVDDEEYEPGLRCLAAPVRDSDGTVAVAMGLSGPTARLTRDVVPQVGDRLRAAAEETRAALRGAWWPAPPPREPA